MSTSQGTPEDGATTRLDDHVARALELMASGEWRLILEHPNPAKGSTFFDLDLTKEIARRAASPSPPPGVARNVAWRWRDDDDRWQVTCDEDKASYEFRVNGREIHDLFAAPPVGVEVVKLAAEPFIAYASLSGFERMPADMPITAGSRLAARQLTAGDLRTLVDTLARLGAAP